MDVQVSRKSDMNTLTIGVAPHSLDHHLAKDESFSSTYLRVIGAIASADGFVSLAEYSVVNDIANNGDESAVGAITLLDALERLTGVQNPVRLVASHCKLWRDSSNQERLDGENGLLLTPSIDHLFDRGFIGFENNGKLIISPVAHRPSHERMGVETRQLVNVGSFSSGQMQFLDFHRNSVFLESHR